MAKTFFALSGAQVTTGAIVKIALSAATAKTIMQLATPSTQQIRVIEWGVSFDASAAAVPGIVELIDTNVAATVTSFGSSDLVKHNGPNDIGSILTLGSTASGYNSSSEGSITAARTLDAQLVAPTNQYLKQFPLGREPEVAVSRFLRIRCNFPAAVNVIGYISWEE